jgi:ATP-dependent DNA ligase
VIAKRKDGIYRPGRRTSEWLKIKARLQQEFVVGGFTEPKGSRKHLGAVVIGAYTGGKLWENGGRQVYLDEDPVRRLQPGLASKAGIVENSLSFAQLLLMEADNL